MATKEEELAILIHKRYYRSLSLYRVMSILHRLHVIEFYHGQEIDDCEIRTRKLYEGY